MTEEGKILLKKAFADAPSKTDDLCMHSANFGSAREPEELLRALCKQEFNDLGNSQRLILRYGNRLIYVPESGWHAWTGKCWSKEKGDQMLQIYAQETIKNMIEEIDFAAAAARDEGKAHDKIKELRKSYFKFYRASGNSARLTAIGVEARPRLTLPSENLDTHLYLFNLQNGILDLKAEDTGEETFDGITLLPHEPRHYITKLANVDYDPQATAPIFQKFIHEILPDDDVRLFMQRFFGYCLSGSNEEQVMVMLWGEGSNGKSTLVELMDYIFGTYALVTPVDSLLHTHNKGQGNEATPALARLVAARLVSAAEPDVGDRLAEGAIKNITGTEKMTARHLRKDFFEFVPQFKVCLSCNNKPYVRGQDDGIWRRLLLVPFEQSFVDAERLDQNPGALPKVKNLDRKLRAENSGILNWILDGYRMWQENGLAVPEKIRAATEEYREESNPVRQFINAWCKKNESASIRATRLYEAYGLWCKENAAEPIKQRAFGKHMTAMKYERYTYQVVFYKGIELTLQAEERLQAEENKSNRSYGNEND